MLIDFFIKLLNSKFGTAFAFLFFVVLGLAISFSMALTTLIFIKMVFLN